LGGEDAEQSNKGDCSGARDQAKPGSPRDDQAKPEHETTRRKASVMESGDHSNKEAHHSSAGIARQTGKA
jgi:hypothetical protein